MKTPQVELAIARHFGWRQNLIVPNVSWGLGLHEIDLLVLTPRGYLWEVEIKVSLGDLKADAKKRHGHNSKKISRLWFAIPAKIADFELYIPERAGILTFKERPDLPGGLALDTRRAPKVNRDALPLDFKDIDHLYRLAAMRVWSLKDKLLRVKGKDKVGAL